MKYGEFKVSQALGIHLYNSINLGKSVIAKGHALTDFDILALKQAGIEQVFGAIVDDDDISCITALGIIAAKLCGDNLAYRIANNGQAQIVATVDGVLINSEERIDKFNRIAPNVIVNVVEPYSLVKVNEIIATLEITEPFVSQNLVDELIFKISGNVELIRVAPLEYLNVSLIYTHMLDNGFETKHFTNVVKKLVKNFTGFKLVFANEYDTKHNVNAVADGIEKMLKSDNDVIFILSSQQTTCEQDIVPAAMNSIVEEIVNLRIPQIGASDLLIAEKNGKKLINIPYNYDSVDTVMINRYIKQAIFSEKLNKFEFIHQPTLNLEEGTMLVDDENNSLIKATNNKMNGNLANVGAVVLAAGIGSRAGRNKLMVEMENGEPLFMRSVKAAIASKASPVFVVTGYHDNEMQEYLDNVDVNVLYNPAYRNGVKTSIALGLKSIQNFCDGVLIIPADMPNITKDDIDKLLAEFKKNKEKQLLMFSYQGKKANPIVWSKELYDKADIVPENSDLRPIFMEHIDYTTLVEVDDDNKFLDITFPSDFEKIK